MIVNWISLNFELLVRQKKDILRRRHIFHNLLDIYKDSDLWINLENNQQSSQKNQQSSNGQNELWIEVNSGAPWGQKQYEHHLVKTGSRR